MGLVQDVDAQLKDAMRAKDKDKLRALRGIRAAFIEALKSDGRETLSDEDAIAILRKLAKSRQESIEAYTAGGRTELAEEERAEFEVIEAFLPQLADADTTRGWVQAAIAATGATSVKDMGRVMGVLVGAHKGVLDGKLAQTIVKELLG